MNIAFANRLLEYRKQHNFSQEELAEKIGVSRQAVSKWERAEASPDTDNLILLAEIYGVTLDELIKGKTEPEEEPAPEPAGNYVKADSVSFKNGIHVEDKDGDSVHINFKNGINVKDKNGDSVHVGFDGINVEENRQNRVYTDSDGNVMVDEQLAQDGHIFSRGKEENKALKIWNTIPYWAIALSAFLIWGFTGVLGGWSVGWICFLTIPLYYSLGDAIFKRRPAHFAYPVLTALLYIIFGFILFSN